jgi:predicted protein tyrosine phosphatase
MPSFQPVIITHPLSTLTEEQIRERALEAVQTIVPIITGKDIERKIEVVFNEVSEENDSLLSKRGEPVSVENSCGDD